MSMKHTQMDIYDKEFKITETQGAKSQGKVYEKNHTNKLKIKTWKRELVRTNKFCN